MEDTLLAAQALCSLHFSTQDLKVATFQLPVNSESPPFDSNCLSTLPKKPNNASKELSFFTSSPCLPSREGPLNSEMDGEGLAPQRSRIRMWNSAVSRNQSMTSSTKRSEGMARIKSETLNVNRLTFPSRKGQSYIQKQKASKDLHRFRNRLLGLFEEKLLKINIDGSRNSKSETRLAELESERLRLVRQRHAIVANSKEKLF
ncbi:hypothetical protein HK096_004151 [Nowakowskiella sp. JEL0078]|nr:hypothetical protein HK096_004151 [Nowakowskiella sp. JEL0078]